MSRKTLTVLLLNPPFKEPIIRDNYCCFTSKSSYIWAPVDLLYLSGNIKSDLIHTYVIDAVATGTQWTSVMKTADNIKPDVVICLTGTASFPDDMQGLKKLQEKTKAAMYVLGNTPAFEPKQFLETYTFIAGVIHNFFDGRIRDFLLKKNIIPESISYRKSDGTLQIGRINYLKPMQEVIINSPPRYELFPMERYSTPIVKNIPMATMLTSFGCPYNCKFCVASSLQYNPRALSDLEKEFEALHTHGIKELFIEDSTFNTRTAFVEAICDLLIKKNYGFTWSANIHSNNATKHVLQKMKDAGCHTVQIGVESGSQEILNEYAPSKKMNKLREAFANCREIGLRTLGYFIIGFPTETAKTARETIQFAHELKPNFASFSVLTPDYGTQLRVEALQNKIISDMPLSAFDCSESAEIQNDKFPRKEQDILIREAYKSFYGKPEHILNFIKDYRHIGLYMKSGLRLLFKKLL